MADPADIANNTVEFCLAEAERRARGKSAPERHPDFDGEHCVDCDEPVVAGRLALGKVRCLDCQLLLEKRRA